MILPHRQIEEMKVLGATIREIPDTEDLYGWVCGYIPGAGEDDFKSQYSTLHDTAHDHCVIVGRDRVYKINEGYGLPIQLKARCTLIHRSDDSWLVYLERETQS